LGEVRGGFGVVPFEIVIIQVGTVNQ
jgi:hypothetical protein